MRRGVILEATMQVTVQNTSQLPGPLALVSHAIVNYGQQKLPHNHDCYTAKFML